MAAVVKSLQQRQHSRASSSGGGRAALSKQQVMHATGMIATLQLCTAARGKAASVAKGKMS
jgi:hypothetical protein